MPPRQPHPVRPSAARGTRCLTKVGPRAASATNERGSETRRLLQRNWGHAAEISVASFLRWGALPRDARFSALVPHARWRNLLASKKRQQLRPFGRNLHRALHSRTFWRVEWLRESSSYDLTAKHLKSVTRKGVWVRLPLPALVIPATYADGGTRARRPHPPTVLKLS